MKKLLVLILMLAMVFCLVVPLSSCNSKSDYDYAFITDIHVVANSTFNAENFLSYTDSSTMIYLTDALLNSVVDDFIEKDYKYVLVGGDIANYGDEASHLVAASCFARLEQAGIDVFVVNGNHDTAWSVESIGQRISASRFKEIYADFGYNQAIASCPDNLSYVADIDKNYRLIAIDSVEHYDADPTLSKSEAMNDAHIEWIKAQVEQCKVDEVTPIIITHESLLNHFPEISDVALTNNLQYDKITTYLADNGANYCFAGHYHMQDIESLTTELGNTFYEAETSAIAFYPCAYREMNFKSKKITINTCYIDSINKDYLSPYCTENIKTELQNGMQEYSYNHFYEYIYDTVSNIGSSKLFSSDSEGNLGTILNIIATQVVEKVANAPYYIKDETSDDVSLERIMQSYGVEIPQTNYKNLADMATFLASKFLVGNENLTAAPELSILKYTVYSIFYYLNQASDDLATALPDYPLINLDLENLFKNGVLECYDSNFIPFVIEGLNSVDSTILDIVCATLSENFDKIGGALITPIVKGLSQGHIETLAPYFEGKNLLLGKFVDELVWGNLASSFVADEAPADDYFEIKLEK